MNNILFAIRQFYKRVYKNRYGLFRKYPWITLFTLLIFLFLVIIFSIGIGSVSISWLDSLKVILKNVWVFNDVVVDERFNKIIWEIRLPRVLSAALIGASLAISGAIFQALFRNHLADPYLIGASGGAALAGVLLLTSSIPSFIFGINIFPLVAFLGSFLAVLLAFFISQKTLTGNLSGLLLAGIAISAFTGSLTSLVMLTSEPDIKPVFSWLLGGLSNTSWKAFLGVLPFFSVGTLLIILLSRLLNVLSLSTNEAINLGVDIKKFRIIFIVIASFLTASAIALSGPIGFIGLISPHISRMILGTDNRIVVVTSLLIGALLLVSADLIARTIINPATLPVGIIVAFVGVPFFIYLLIKAKNRNYT